MCEKTPVVAAPSQSGKVHPILITRMNHSPSAPFVSSENVTEVPTQLRASTAEQAVRQLSGGSFLLKWEQKCAIIDPEKLKGIGVSLCAFRGSVRPGAGFYQAVGRLWR